MSATVVIDRYRGYRDEVPRVDRAEVDADGKLMLFQGYSGESLAIYRACHWESVVIHPERGPNGRFVRK